MLHIYESHLQTPRCFPSENFVYPKQWPFYGLPHINLKISLGKFATKSEIDGGLPFLGIFTKVDQTTINLQNWLHLVIIPFFLHSNAFKFTNKTTSRIGKVYKKAVYREFTNSSFTEQKPRDNKMGILGPVLKGQLRDVIHIYFKVYANL